MPSDKVSKMRRRYYRLLDGKAQRGDPVEIVKKNGERVLSYWGFFRGEHHEMFVGRMEISDKRPDPPGCELITQGRTIAPENIEKIRVLNEVEE